MNYTTTSRIWRRHGGKIVFGLLIAGSLALNSRNIERSMQSMYETNQTIATNNQRQSLLEEQFNHEQAQARIAEARYKAGCAIVVAASENRSLATLVEGETVLDRTTQKPLPVGTVVCDGSGNTGVLAAGKDGVPVVTQMAFTGNRELAIAQIKKIRGAKLYFYTPKK
jgi:hypothetical protein